MGAKEFFNKVKQVVLKTFIGSLGVVIFAGSMSGSANAMFNGPNDFGNVNQTQTVTQTQVDYSQEAQYKKAEITFNALQPKLDSVAIKKGMSSSQFYKVIAQAIDSAAVKQYNRNNIDQAKFYGFLSMVIQEEAGVSNPTLAFDYNGGSSTVANNNRGNSGGSKSTVSNNNNNNNNNSGSSSHTSSPTQNSQREIVEIDARGGTVMIGNEKVDYTNGITFAVDGGTVYIESTKIDDSNSGDKTFKVNYTVRVGNSSNNPFGNNAIDSGIQDGDVTFEQFDESSTIKVDVNWLLSKTNNKNLLSMLELIQNEVEQQMESGISVQQATNRTIQNIDNYQKRVLAVVDNGMSDEEKIMEVAKLIRQDYLKDNDIRTTSKHWSRYSIEGVLHNGQAACQGMFSAYTLGMFLAKTNVDLGYEIGKLTSGISHITAYINGKPSDITAINSSFDIGAADLYTSATFSNSRVSANSYLGW